MFSTLDNSLINLAQWIVRQLELFTPITRKVIGNALLSFHATAIALCFCMGVDKGIQALRLGYHTHSSVFWSLFWIANFLFVFSFIEICFYKNATRIIRKKQKSGLLPEEILARKNKRILGIIGLFIAFCPFVLPLLLLNEVILEALTLSVLVLANSLLEYFFCTTSLPPGEKEKKKVEREMKYLSLQRISGK